jgi:Ca2+/Na+ antiporter
VIFVSPEKKKDKKRLAVSNYFMDSVLLYFHLFLYTIEGKLRIWKQHSNQSAVVYLIYSLTLKSFGKVGCRVRDVENH